MHKCTAVIGKHSVFQYCQILQLFAFHREKSVARLNTYQ